jgi:replication-associated recombination protein RarA
MVLMKVFLNQHVQGGQRSQLNLVEMIQGVKQDDRSMDVQKMIHQLKDDRLMDDQNYLVDLNFCDSLPYAYSLTSIEI